MAHYGYLREETLKKTRELEEEKRTTGICPPSIQAIDDGEWAGFARSTYETIDEFHPIEKPVGYNSHPSGVECIQIVEHMDYCRGNIFKYIFRYKYKNGTQDLQKAITYIQFEIARLSKEIWKEFPSDSRYEVSCQGNVRMKGKDNRRLVKIKGGYLTFLTSKEGNSKLYYAHRAVAEAFLGEIPIDMQVCHIDGNKENNRSDNLYIGTCKQNHKDKIKHRTDNSGVRNSACKLTIQEVNEIRQLDKTYSDTELGGIYGVSRQSIQRIRTGKSFKNPTYEPDTVFEKFNEVNLGWEKEVFQILWEKRGDTQEQINGLRICLYQISGEMTRLGKEKE